MKGKKWVSLLLAGAMAACAMGGTAAFAEESETQTTAVSGEDAAAAEEVPVVDSVEEAAEVLGVEDTDRDNYLTAEEAKAYGLIDEIIVKH